jgi:hypothetical protein
VKIIEQPAAFTDQSQKATTLMMVFRMRLEMFRELFDARGKQRNLYFSRTTVVAGAVIALKNFLSASGLEGHQVLILSFLFQSNTTITDHCGLVKHASYHAPLRHFLAVIDVYDEAWLTSSGSDAAGISRS